MGMNTGITKSQLKQVFLQVGKHIGKQQEEIANSVLLKMVDN
jgi:hypothetical protein